MALPVTITGLLVATTNIETLTKPFLSSAGNVYVFGKGTTTNLLRAFKATDPTSSFSNVGSDVTVTSTNQIRAVDAVQSGDEIHVVTSDAAAASSVDLRYHVFNMSSDTWTTSNEAIVTGYALVALATAIHAAINIRSDGDVIVLYNGAALSGLDEAVYYARRESGSWTADVIVSTAGSTQNWYAGGIVRGSSDRMHFFFINDDVNDAYQRTLTSANSLETLPASYDTSINSTQISTLATGTSYESGGVTKVRYPQEDSTGVILLSAKMDSADTPTVSTDADITGTTDIESGSHRASFAADGTTLWNTFVQTTTSDMFTQSNANDGGWSTPASFATINSNGVRTNIYNRGGSVVIAMVYNDSSNPVYNEKLLKSAAAIDTDPTATLTWGGEAVSAGSSDGALDSDAAASLTWGASSTSSGAWSSISSGAAAGGVVGASVAGATWNASAVASVTLAGTSVDGAAWSASAAATVTLAGASVATSTISASAAGTVTWGGASISAGFGEGDAALTATATLEWVGATIDAQDWRVVARFGFPPSTNRWDGASISDGDWQASAAAEATFANASIVTASADFSIGATASASFTGIEISPYVFDHVVLDGKTPKPYRPVGMDEEDIPFIMAAITTVMENNHVNY